MDMKKIFYMIGGCISLGLGTGDIGITQKIYHGNY